MTTHFALLAIDATLPALGPRRLSFSNDPASGASRSTILIGRNGTGKSSMLREIAMSFRAYFASHQLRSRQGSGNVSRIEMLCDGHFVGLDIGADAKTFGEDRDALRARGAGPSKLIALSFTPFDKFPPSDDTRGLNHQDAQVPFYVYLGFKSDFRISPRARLLRSIDELAFASSTAQTDHRVVQAFRAIGYYPDIAIGYDFVPPRNYGAEDPRLLDVYERLKGGSKSARRGVPALTYKIDFLAGRRDSSIDVAFEDLRELTRARLLRVSTVTLRRSDDQSVELLELSSGELNLLSGFLGLAAFLEDGCLVLIDEPENSLHPEWQVRYVEMLEAVLSQHAGCHYVIATHSPLVVSGIANENTTILRLDQEPIELSGQALSHASPDATLVNAFDVVTPGNNFLKQLVLEAVSLIETGKQDSIRARQIAAALSKTYERIPPGDPIRLLAFNVIQAIKSAA